MRRSAPGFPGSKAARIFHARVDTAPDPAYAFTICL